MPAPEVARDVQVWSAVRWRPPTLEMLASSAPPLTRPPAPTESRPKPVSVRREAGVQSNPSATAFAFRTMSTSPTTAVAPSVQLTDAPASLRQTPAACQVPPFGPA